MKKPITSTPIHVETMLNTSISVSQFFFHRSMKAPKPINNDKPIVIIDAQILRSYNKKTVSNKPSISKILVQ